MPILNFNFLYLQEYCKIYEGITSLNNMYNILVICEFFCCPYDKFKNSEKIARQGISLPIDPNLKKSEIIKICKVINSL